jgi:hypothetical protein
MKHLNIVVPYRARESHLKFFVPAVRAYFSRDKVDCEIPYRVLIVEQDNELPFNRGALKNIGFMLGRDNSDYTCFHDIDYLPIWADYSWSDVPTAIVWHGAERRPVAPGRSQRMLAHNLDEFFSAVVLAPNEIFASVNGYANAYWGWGFEDIDLRNRFTATGVPFGRRKGTFQGLDHDNEGLQLDGAPTPIAAVNQQICERRWGERASTWTDGLQDLAFEITHRRSIPEGPTVERPALWEMVTVRLRMQPQPEQVQAIAMAPVVWPPNSLPGGRMKP